MTEETKNVSKYTGATIPKPTLDEISLRVNKLQCFKMEPNPSARNLSTNSRYETALQQQHAAHRIMQYYDEKLDWEGGNYMFDDELQLGKGQTLVKDEDVHDVNGVPVGYRIAGSNGETFEFHSYTATDIAENTDLVNRLEKCLSVNARDKDTSYRTTPNLTTTHLEQYYGNLNWNKTRLS